MVDMRLLLLSILLLPAIGLAADIPPGAMVEGTIDAVNTSRGSVVVDDEAYRLTATTRVERDDGRTGSISDLAEGQRVGLVFSVGENANYYLRTVRILTREGTTTYRSQGSFQGGVTPR